jgi:hypothetical protein
MGASRALRTKTCGQGVYFLVADSARSGSRNCLTVVAKPVAWEFKVAADTIWSIHKVNRPTELVGN